MNQFDDLIVNLKFMVDNDRYNFCLNSIWEFYCTYAIKLKYEVHVLSNFLKSEYVSYAMRFINLLFQFLIWNKSNIHK
jgi:hypothetical protein